MNDTGTVIRNRCVRCKAPIRGHQSDVPLVTVIVAGRELRGFHCDPCADHVAHTKTCTTSVHVERWA